MNQNVAMSDVEGGSHNLGEIGILAQVKIDRELRRASVYMDDAGGIAESAAVVAHCYHAAAIRLLPAIENKLHIIFDPTLTADERRAPRYLIIPMEEPKIATVIQSVTKAKIKHDDLIVVLGPAFAGYDGSDEEFDEIVANDLGAVISKFYQVKCHGQIATLMPYLAQMGAAIALIQNPTPEFQEKCEALGLMALADSIGASWGGIGQAATDYPAYIPLARAVSTEVIKRRARSAPPVSFEDAAQIYWDGIMAAMIACGVPVQLEQVQRRIN